MKRIFLFCTMAVLALAQQGCTATFHSLSHHPSHHTSRVDIHIDYPSHGSVRVSGKYNNKKYYARDRRAHGKTLLGMRQQMPEPPQRPEPPRKPRR